MKTKINNLLKIGFLAVFAILSLTVSAQSYYTPGQVYSYRNKINSTQTLKVDVVFDNAGNATVTKSIVDVMDSDKNNSFILANPDKVSFSDASCVNLIGELNEFWAVELDNVNGTAVPVGGLGGCPSCPCKKGKGACSVAKIKTNNGYNIWCDTTLDCDVCGEMTFNKPSGEQTGTVLIIQAKSVIFN